MANGALSESIESAIGYRFANPALLEQALRHSSNTEDRLDSNERLEFLGDAILGSIVCRLIFDRFPDLLEGEMTKIKSAVVSRRTCAACATRLGLEDALELGKGMQHQRELPSSLAAGVFESVIAAIYLDGGSDAAERFVTDQMVPIIERIARSGHQQNYKSLLQQHAQHLFSEVPEYRILDEKGPDHAKCFKIAVGVGAREFDPAWGPSKKQAEQLAALTALRELGVVARDSDEVIVIDD